MKNTKKHRIIPGSHVTPEDLRIEPPQTEKTVSDAREAFIRNACNCMQLINIRYMGRLRKIDHCELDYLQIEGRKFLPELPTSQENIPIVE